MLRWLQKFRGVKTQSNREMSLSPCWHHFLCLPAFAHWRTPFVHKILETCKTLGRIFWVLFPKCGFRMRKILIDYSKLLLAKTEIHCDCDFFFPSKDMKPFPVLTLQVQKPRPQLYCQIHLESDGMQSKPSYSHSPKG